MSRDLVVDEGAAIALERAERDHARQLLGGLAEVDGDTLTVSRVVGHIRLPTGRTLRIRSPKAKAASVIAWAAYADPRLAALRAVRGRVPVGGDDGDIATLLGKLFIHHLEDAIGRHGLVRNYRRDRTETETIRGRIDFARLARRGANLGRVPCEVWERSEATALNRLLVATLVECARDPLLLAACEPGLSRVRARMASIEPGVDRELLDATRDLRRDEEPFAAVLALARMLLRGMGLLEGNKHLGDGFLVNLEALFESAVVRALRENGVVMVAKAQLPYSRWSGTHEQPGSMFELDALCRVASNALLVVDAKYKRKISSGNLHQMIAYFALSGATRGAFVVPAEVVADRRAYLFERADGVRVRVDVLELSTDAADIDGWRQNGRRLADEITGLSGATSLASMGSYSSSSLGTSR